MSNPINCSSRIFDNNYPGKSGKSPYFSGPEQQRQQQTPATPLTWQQWASSMQAVPQVLGQYADTNQIAQDLQKINAYGGGELLSLLGPRAAAIAPWLGPGYIGLDVYNQARKIYEANAELERQQRIRETAIKTGDIALAHGLATLGIPLLLTRQVNRLVHHFTDKPKTPALFARHPRWVTTFAMLGLMLVLAKPIQMVTNFVLNWTYRPLLEKKRREEVQKILQKQLERQTQWLQMQSLLNSRRNTMTQATNTAMQSGQAPV